MQNELDKIQPTFAAYRAFLPHTWSKSVANENYSRINRWPAKYAKNMFYFSES